MRSPKFWIKDVALAGCRLLAGRGPVHAILLYHSIGGEGGVPVHTLTRQLEYLCRHFRVVRLRDLPASLTEEHSVVSVTFDDGYVDNYDHALPILERLGLKGTFFLVSSSIEEGSGRISARRAYLNWDEARELVSLGHEIGAHTATHQKLTEIPAERARREIVDGKIALEDRLDIAVTSFAYPWGQHNDVVRELVRKAGFPLAVTVREGIVGDAPDWLALPRISAGPTVGIVQFWAKLSPGLVLYEKLRGRQ